jgi:hypothetical protein
MPESYQDPDPISSNNTQTRARKDSTGESGHPVAAHSNLSFAAAADDDATLVNQDVPHDPDAEFSPAAEPWKFKLKDRNASASATEVGDHARATSVDDRSSFADLMDKTRGMTPDQVKAFLKAREKADGEKIMNGR